MDLPEGNFFQVTINSQKLFGLIGQISAKMQKHEARFKEVELLLQRTSSVVDKKNKDQKEYVEIELEKVRKSMKEEVNYMRLFMKDVDKKTTDKIGELENTVMTVKDIMFKTKHNLEDQLALKFSFMDKKLQAIGYLQNDLKESNQHIEGVKKEVEELASKCEGENLKLQFQINRVRDITDKLSQRLTKAELAIQMPREVSRRNSIDQNKKKNKRSEDSEFKSQCYLNILNRIQEVDHKIASNIGTSSAQIVNSNSQTHLPRRSIVSNNKIIKSPNFIKSGNNTAKKQNRFMEFQNNIFSKLEKIQNSMLQKMKTFEREQYLFSNKAQIVDQHIGILSRKLEKQKNKIIQVTQVTKNFQDRKIDQKVIENLKNMIKKMSKEYEDNLQQKISKQTYDKDKSKMLEKINFVSDTVLQKAEKSQMKKGLTFLEDKLKDIIIVLAQQRKGGQDGAMKKAPYKCLSCDKDLQADKNEILSRKQNNITHCNTSQMRKRIRMVNNTVSTVQFNDD